METTSDDVLRRAVQGDREALVTLLRRHGPTVRAGLAGRIPQRWQAVLSEDDVMQQTYADAAAKIGQFVATCESSFAKWLETIARRNLRDALKLLEAEKRGGNRTRVEPRTHDASLAALCEVLAGTGTSPSRGAARNEAKADLQHAVRQLPEVYAQVITLYDLEGRSPNEVATALGRSLGAVFMLRARAHDRLHEILGRTSAFFSSAS